MILLEKLLIKNARVIDPSSDLDGRLDILIENSVIKQIKSDIDCAEAEIINADGLIAAPGLVDLHVHLRDPGLTYKEDIISGAKAAAAGGVTSVAAMPNTKPVVDNAEVLRDIYKRAKNADINIKQLAAITYGQLGGGLTDFEALKKAGAAALSDDGVPVKTAKLMYEAMLWAKELDMPIFAHCEDKSIAGGGIMNEGEASGRLGVPGIPNAAEDAGVARELCLAENTGSKIHICHVSTAQSVDMIRRAKENGVKATCETCPHYFAFNDEKLLLKDADYRMNPPLRAEKDRCAVIEGIRNGVIDVISTDHAPHCPEEKENFLSAMNGVTGMETSLSAGITYLVKTGVININTLINMMSCKPARILGIAEGTLKIGSQADIVIFDMEEKWTVDTEKLRGKSRNAVFKGVELTGRVKYTLCRGKIVYKA